MPEAISPSEQNPSGEIVKATFNMTRGELDYVKLLSTARRVDENQVLRQAIASERYITELRESGYKLAAISPEGVVNEIVFSSQQEVQPQEIDISQLKPPIGDE